MSDSLAQFSQYISQIDTPVMLPEVKRPKIVVVGERTVKLNKSGTKSVSVGICYKDGFFPCIKLYRNKNQQVIFNESDWQKFLSHQGVISNFLFYGGQPNRIVEETFSVGFEQFSNNQIILISMGENFIYLGYETLCTLFEILPLLRYRIKAVRNQQFAEYFQILKRGLQRTQGDLYLNVLNILEPEKNPNSENISVMQELVYLYPEVLKAEIGHEGQACYVQFGQ